MFHVVAFCCSGFFLSLKLLSAGAIDVYNSKQTAAKELNGQLGAIIWTFTIKQSVGIETAESRSATASQISVYSSFARTH